MKRRAAFRLECFCTVWRIAVPDITVELSVGDVLLIGNRTVTVIDIEGSEVHFRVDEDHSPNPLAPDSLTHTPEARKLRLKAK